MTQRITIAQRQRLEREARARHAVLGRVFDAITRKTGITPSGLILAVMSVAAWLGAYWIGGRPLFIVAYGGLVVLAVSWTIGRRPLPLTGTRTDPRPRVREGDEVTIEVQLTAGRRLATLLLEEQVPPMIGDHARLPIPELAAGESVGHQYSVTAWRRGSYTIGPLVARWGDPFGLTEREQKLADEFELLVHPSVEPVTDHPLTRMWEDPPFRPPISRPWSHGMEFYGMRAYQFGDDIRRIVWRAYARTGELLVREAEQGITDKLVIIFDQDENFHSKGLVSDSFEAACRAAASLGVHHLREGYSVTLEGSAERLVGPLRGPSKSIQLLDVLAWAEPCRGSLASAFDRIILSMPRDADVLVVTPLLDADAAARLRMLVDRGISAVVVALMWLDEAVDTLASAASLGVRVVELGPNSNMTLAFRRESRGGDPVTVTEAPPTAIVEPPVGEPPPVAPPPTPPPPTGDTPESDTRPPVADLIRPVLAAALATSAAALVSGGIFGSWGARIAGLIGGVGGAFWVLLALRSRRTNLLVSLFPVVAIAVGVFSLVLRGESPGDLPRLVGDAIDAGRLFRPPVPYDAGWTPILIVLMAVIGFACAWIGTALDRAKIAVVIPIPIAGLTAITQPENQQVLAGVLAFFPILAALAVLFGGNADRARGLGGAFEIKRAGRAAAAAVPLLVLVVLMSRATFLFPEPVYDPNEQPQKPKPVPLSAARDRVLFEVSTDAGLTGPWRAGVLDIYDDDGFWKTSPRDLKPLPAGGKLSNIRSGSTQVTVTITVRDLGDSSVFPGVAGTTRVDFVPSAPGQTRYDNRTQLLRMETGRVPAGLVYSLSLPNYPTTAELTPAKPPSKAAFRDQLVIPTPPAVVRDILRQAPPTPWARLDLLRQKLLANITAKGTGTPVAITAARVEKMFKEGATATPYQIVAAEAMLARWAGVPARIGFGFDGLNAEDKVLTVRPRNSAQWLEVNFEGFGWLPLVGAPQKAAQNLETDPNARFNPAIEASDDVAVEVFLPFEIKEVKQLYQQLRDLLIAYLPLLVAVIAGFVVWPFFSKWYRRGKRRRWAAAHGPRAQIAVEYAEFRDLATDLNVADIYSTPLEYLFEVTPDPEHAELAWLTARALYGDMVRVATEDDVLAAERLATSLRRRLLRGQPMPVQIGALISRASIKMPYTTEVPNIRLVQLPRLRLRWRPPTLRVPVRALVRR